MRIYVSDGRVYVALNETMDICKFDQLDTLKNYKNILLERVSERFDLTVTKAALKGMEETKVESGENGKNADTSSKHPELQSKQEKASSEPQETGADQPQELFRAPKDGPKQAAARKPRQRIDYGKIMALHNAGWNNQKIADEMGMTYNAVATAISSYKKKMKAEEGKA